MMNKTNASVVSGAAQSTAPGNAGASAINVEQLAAKVYQLMLEDVRLARARGGTCRIRKNGYGN